MPFKLTSNYSPKGDQAKAIAELSRGLRGGDPFQTLLNVRPHDYCCGRETAETSRSPTV